ncbi:hypothetical protein IWQ60_007045 [Tieghemiomyces parasiticus]|uniref:Uncharacterized protein n=1 Tax=Tieghemiomyces parasiticus TaxID=78921 RepID=A0A9W8DW28_9FUNG|nr:hypothetical protein IWQ60_007045 [Tieghemiomyces parasiticus]
MADSAAQQSLRSPPAHIGYGAIQIDSHPDTRGASTATCESTPLPSYVRGLRWLERIPGLQLLPAVAVTVLLWNLPIYPASMDPTGPRILSVYAGMIVAVMTTSYELSVLILMTLAFLTVTQNFQCHTRDGRPLACNRCGTSRSAGLPSTYSPLATADRGIYECDGLSGAFDVAISGFVNKINWLVFCAFHIGKAVMLTGLGQRIGFGLLRAMSGSVLSLGYAFCLVELALAPFVPSNTARGGGIIYPIVISVVQALNADHTHNAATARFLVFTAAQANLISSSFYITGMAGNPLLTHRAHTVFDIEWDFSRWFVGNLGPGLTILAITPLLTYALFRPKLDPEMAQMAIAHRSSELKPFSRAEAQLCVILLTALVAWVTTPWTGVDSTVVAFLAFALVVVTEVLPWREVLANHTAWDTLFWLGSFIILAQQLNEFGVSAWLGSVLSYRLDGLGPWSALWALAVIYAATMYLFSSMTSHIMALSAPLLMAAANLGCPPLPAIAIVSYLGPLSACVTNYSTGVLSMYFSEKYIERSAWFRLGLIMLVVYMAVYATVGVAWWKLLQWY